MEKNVSFLLLLCSLYAFSQAFLPFDVAKDVFDKGVELGKKPIEFGLNTVVFRNKCMEDLGCFYTGPPFYHPIYRPVSLAPFDLEDMHTNFWLFTPQSIETPERLEPSYESLEASSFDPQAETKVLIHGYLTTLEKNDSRYRMKDAFLAKDNYNVIVVDWTSSNQRPYPQAVANARVVGAQLAQLIKFLENATGVSPESFHLIGHSLGSHVSGWAGERITNLGRITGLDPAGPCFQNAEEEVRLDTTDANFLDIIHTDNGNNIVQGLGIKEPIGDLDFYPNGGGFQPGCEPTFVNVTVAGINFALTGTDEGVTKLLLSSCDHNRANELFLASIVNTDCKFISTACKNYDKYKNGDCKKGQTAEMGVNAKQIRGLREGTKFYLQTTDEAPFCIQEGSTDATTEQGFTDATTTNTNG